MMVDDEEKIRGVVVSYLQNLMLPDLSGEEVCQAAVEIRSQTGEGTKVYFRLPKSP